MEHFYSLKKIVLSLTAALISCAAISQVCGPVIQDFNNTGGSMAGFTSTTLNSTATGFTFGQTGQNGYLQRCNIPSANTTYEIVSPTFQPIGTPTYQGYGFQLSGAVMASYIFVYFQYIDNANQINTVLDTLFVNPTYTGTGGNATLTICDSFLLSRATGFTAGDRYRILVDIVTASASNANQCIVFDNFRTTGAASAAALPVSFVGFAAKKSGGDVVLTWNVAGERDVQTYEVERGTAGGNFTKLGEVAAANRGYYTFTDHAPAIGVAFYRVKEIDADGKFRYSTIVKLNLSNNFSLRAYPSPARDEVTIEHASTNKGTLSVTTMDGRILKQVDLRLELNQTIINLSGLKAGLYVVRFVNADGKTETTKLIKE
jgi:hypothetical protein